MTWERTEDPLDPFPTYGDNKLFTIKMYHSGELTDDFYVRGKVDFFDFCDKDFMSLLKVDNMVKDLGYENPLRTDSDVINMCKFVLEHMMIDTNVVIQEIDGDEDDQRRPVQISKGNSKLAFEYPVSGLVDDCNEWKHGCPKMKTYRAMTAAFKIIEGFKVGCRPLIGLDGCHLKSRHGVIAYAVVEMENKDSWIWFL
ncbi:hypothetical protein D8674_027659 [Pyrus ussuriensis x Pyrus communis]|uniref:PB1-like domain-containing protein n=1 Tax=Pyrus ussuriensis x Pyrus communis TaxID=2448454 RepID=A0A5N5IAC4_9ROSA|nr:hypothetical protein D8674_027659 [Pyrus ussuriensis x Pyrus communis]